MRPKSDIEELIDGLKSRKNAEISPFVWTRIQSKLIATSSEVVTSTSFQWSLAAIIVLILLNILVSVQFNNSSKNAQQLITTYSLYDSI